MSKHSRAAEIDARIDTDTGEFDMVMASEGEASDGHIISIRGLEAPQSIPLQLDHARGAVANLGTVTNMRRDTIDGLPVMRGVGQIRMSGDGEALAARRDLVDAIATGHVRGVSLTWESTKARERRDLPTNHPAHVKRNEKDPRKRFGLYFDQATPIEQSIVGIPADREALIGRSESAEDAFSRAMWETLVERLDDAPRSREAEIIEALEGKLSALEERLRDAEAQRAESDESPTPDLLETDLLAFAARVKRSRVRADQIAEDAAEEWATRLGIRS